MGDPVCATVAGPSSAPAGRVDLYWLPLGAGGHVVRRCGRVFESIVARRARRSPCELYHSALEVTTPQGRFVVEMTPTRRDDDPGREVVCSGAVGHRLLGRLPLFRYEIRRWRNGVIPDVEWAVDSPVRVVERLATANRLLNLVPAVPTPVWGRDELRAGEMWNSNSVVSWLITAAGLDAAGLVPPRSGRAPGWHAGIEAARRGSPHAPSGAKGPVRSGDPFEPAPPVDRAVAPDRRQV